MKVGNVVVVNAGSSEVKNEKKNWRSWRSMLLPCEVR